MGGRYIDIHRFRKVLGEWRVHVHKDIDIRQVKSVGFGCCKHELVRKLLSFSSIVIEIFCYLPQNFGSGSDLNFTLSEFLSWQNSSHGISPK